MRNHKIRNLHHSREVETPNKVVLTRRRLILTIGSLSVLLGLLIFKAGLPFWPDWLIHYRFLFIGILGFIDLFLALFSPIILEFTKDPRSLSGPGKNPEMGPDPKIF